MKRFILYVIILLLLTPIVLPLEKVSGLSNRSISTFVVDQQSMNPENEFSQFSTNHIPHQIKFNKLPNKIPNAFSYTTQEEPRKSNRNKRGVDTFLDIASTGYSAVEFIQNPSWRNAGYLTWDVVASFTPFIPGSYSVKAIRTMDKAPNIGKKLEYVFGHASGSIHNVQRSIDMGKQLNRIGIFDNKVGRELVQDNLTKAYHNPSSIRRVQENGRIVRESLLSGPNGFVKIESIWEDSKLITVKIFGGK